MVEAVGPVGSVFTISALLLCQGLPDFAVPGDDQGHTINIEIIPISQKNEANKSDGTGGLSV